MRVFSSHIVSLLPQQSRELFLIYAIAFGMTLGLAVAGLIIDPDLLQATFEEGGPVERLSMPLWFALAGYISGVMRRMTPAVMAGIAVCLFSAAREADLHTAYTGYSVLKVRYYIDPEFPLPGQVVAGLIMLVFVTSLVIVGARLVRCFRSQQEGRRPFADWARGSLFIIATIIGVKIIDRMPALLEEELGIELSPHLFSAALAVEEGIELAVPLLLILVVRSFVREEQKPSRMHARHNDQLTDLSN